MMGGSIANAIKKNKLSKKIFGFDINDKNTKFAKRHKLIDEYDLLNNFYFLKKSELIIICSPTKSYKRALLIINKHRSDSALITDIGSTKKPIINELKKKIYNLSDNFIGSHPLAGTEKCGVKNFSSNLFKDKTVILTPTDKTLKKNLKLVANFWKKLGCNILTLSPEIHDDILAKTSHVPHLVSYALLNSIFENIKIKNIDKFTGGGFKDFARIAKSDPLMWKEICELNKHNIDMFLTEVIKNLNLVKKNIRNNNFNLLYKYFSKANKNLS